jgi:CO/xanthine dehydrogenase FAD-binding subunit
MPFEAILWEVEQLHEVSERLAVQAERYPLVSEALMTIAGSVRNTATILGVLIATKMRPV